MAEELKIVVTGQDVGATKVLDDVSASSRAVKKAQQDAAKASQLAAQVMGEAGGQVREQSVRLVQAKLAEKKAAEELSAVQKAASRGLYEEADAARVTAAAMENLARAKMHVVAINVAPPPMPVTPRQTFHGAAEALEKRELASEISAGSVLHERMNERLGEFGISEGMGGMAAGVAAVTVGVGEIAEKMREAVNEALEFGEQMSRAAVKTGLPVETLSVLHYAAKTTGGDFESMAQSVAKMDKTIGAATEGNKKAQAFLKALGLDANDLAGRADGAEVAFQKFATTLATTENPIRRVELATGLLGKTGAEQIPTLVELGEHWEEFRAGAERTGTMLDGKTAAALQKTQDKLDELKEKARGAGLAFTEGFLPALDQLLTVFSGPGVDGMQAFKALGEDIGRVFEFVAGRLYDTASAAAAVASVALGGPFTEAGKHLAQLRDEFSVKSGKLEYAAVTGKEPQKTQGDLAYEAGLGKSPGGETDSVMEALRKRNHARAEGFDGVGDLTGGADKANQKRLKAMEAALDEEKLQFSLSVKAEYDYWTERQAAFAKGSAEYDTILHKRTELAVAGARKDSELIAKFKADQRRLAAEQAPEDKAGPAFARQDAQAQESRFDTSNELYAIEQRTQAQLAEMAVRQQVGRTLTAEAAAMQIAAIHTQAYGAELARLEAKRKEIAENPLLSNGEADQQRKVDQLTRQIAEIEAGRQIQVAQDTYAVKDADQSAVRGATDALNEFRMETMDAARQMHELTTTILNGVHRQLLNAVTGEKTDVRGLGREVATGVADMGLKKMESNAMNSMRPLLEKFGLGDMFGKTKRDGASASTALYVYDIAGNGKAPTVVTGSEDLAKVLDGIHIPGMPEYKGHGEGAMRQPWDEAGAKIPGVAEPHGMVATVMEEIGRLFGGHKKSSDGGAVVSSDEGSSTTDTLLTGLSRQTGGMFGGGKADGSSPSSPLYVKNVGGAAGGSMPGLSMFGGGDDSGDSGDGGGFFASIGKLSGGGGGDGGDSAGGGLGSILGAFMHLRGFADGVDDFAGGPAIVGERGPELVNLPRGASVVPNHMAFGGGSKYEHNGDININAGDGVDKEELKGHVHRAVDARMALHMRGMGSSMADARSRVPAGRRGF